MLTIGIGDYGKAARHLDLAYAARDAEDVAIALRNSQSSLFAEVRVRVLVDRNATKDMIFNELSAMASAMQQGGGNDLGVILFAGHGEVVGDGRFYLLPHGTSVASQGALKATGLAATTFRDEIAAIARHGRVLVLLDACRSGGATSPMDRSLRALLTAPNVTVFTSSTAGETSYEHPDWENGAFTEALLEAFREADYDNDTLIRLSDLSRYLAERVPVLTAGRQHPDVEIVGQDVRILAAAL
ncbi:MAG: caspase family protein [Rhodovulum sp.]